jgi:hypothetical protein
MVMSLTYSNCETEFESVVGTRTTHDSELGNTWKRTGQVCAGQPLSRSFAGSLDLWWMTTTETRFFSTESSTPGTPPVVTPAAVPSGALELLSCAKSLVPSVSGSKSEMSSFVNPLCQ